jgi:iron complex transport system permease protein
LPSEACGVILECGDIMKNLTIGKRIILSSLILLLLLIAVLALDISYGESHLPLSTVARVVWTHISGGHQETGNTAIMQDSIVWGIRVPRSMLALLVGAMLAMAGAALQGLLLNPLADPYTVGVSSGAALGAGIATVLGLDKLLGGFGVPPVAFVFAMGAMAIVYGLARSSGRVSVQSFLLAGIVIGSFLWSLLSLIIAMSSGDPADAQAKIIAWLMGSFSNGDGWQSAKIAAPFALLGFIGLWSFARDLNVYSMGEETAKHLGIEAEYLKIFIISICALVTAAAVSVSGIIGFVGLVVPHMCRKMFGPDHRVLIPASALGGAVLAVLADFASRIVMPPSGMPVGVVTAMLGAPFFLYLLRTNK